MFDITFQNFCHAMIRPSNQLLVNLFYQITETLPLTRCGAFTYNMVSLRQLLNCLCLLKAHSLGLPYWVRPAVINVMNRADLRKVRRGRTRRHEPDAKYESTTAKTIL